MFIDFGWQTPKCVPPPILNGGGGGGGGDDDNNNNFGLCKYTILVTSSS